MRRRLIASAVLGSCVLVFTIATGFWTWMLFNGSNNAARDRAEYFAWHWGCAMMVSLVVWMLHLVQTVRSFGEPRSHRDAGPTPIHW